MERDIYLKETAMTVRKQFALIIGSIIILAVVIYSVVSSLYVDKYFSGYVESEYGQKVENLKEKAARILIEDESEKQAANTLGAYLDSVIVEISVLDINGDTVVSVKNQMPMMRHSMTDGRAMYYTEKSTMELKDGTNTIGLLVIGKTGSQIESENISNFKHGLRISTIISAAAALGISAIIIFLAASGMTKDLRRTAKSAQEADSEAFAVEKYSGTLEIRSIQHSLEELSSKLKVQKRLRREKADRLAHEVRTPLSILKTNVEGVRDKIITMDESRLDSCIAEIDHLSAIVEGISDIVEYDSAEVKINPNTFNAAKLIKKIVKGFKPQFDKKGIELSYYGIENIDILSDKDLIAQTVYNLISNAFKFTPEGGRSYLELLESREDITIKVCDNGAGIKDADKQRIFEAYNRAGAPSYIPGDGLGLFIAKKNIEALGGEISVTDAESGGTEFKIKIPKKYNEI